MEWPLRNWFESLLRLVDGTVSRLTDNNVRWAK